MRGIDEWVGKTDDQAIPLRVVLRVLDSHGGRCACGCGCEIGPGVNWVVDHVIALINGGENRESNLQPLLTEHHKPKTRNDVRTKAKIARVKSKHLGLRRSSRPMPGGRDSPWKKTFSGKVVRR